MRKYILVILAVVALFATSCVTQKKCNNKYPPVIIQKTDSIHDSIFIKESNKEKSLAKQDDFNLAYTTMTDFWQSKTGRKLSDNKTSRSNFKKLLAEHTTEEIQRAVNGAVYFQGKQYKPQVLSFGSMYEKWDSLMGHMDSVERGSDESNRFE